jgi:hypothetical protein
MVELMKVHREKFSSFIKNINLRIVKWSFGELDSRNWNSIVWELQDMVFVAF